MVHSWPYSLPSAQEGQWHLSTWATLPAGNWHYNGHMLSVLDNGEVWFFTLRWQGMFAGSSWEVQTVGPFESEYAWFGRLRPEGNERVVGDDLVYGASWIPNVNEGPRLTDTYLPNSVWTGFSTNIFEGFHMVNDGTMLYIYHCDDVKGPVWYKIDPSTLTFEPIAGGNFASESVGIVNAPIGRNASFRKVGQPVYFDGYLYWPENPTAPGGQAINTYLLIRRMSLTPPYPVETFFEVTNPSGFTGGSELLDGWMKTNNPSTGRPNAFNNDFFSAAGSRQSMVKWGDHFYLQSTGQFPAIRRISATNPTEVETLIWGIDRRGGADAPHASDVDNRRTSIEYPSGDNFNAGIPNSQSIQVVRTDWIDYEGLDLLSYMVVLNDGSLFMTNWADGIGAAGGYNIWATSIVMFSLPELIAAFEVGGPQRMNRANPQWRTVAGGTAATNETGRLTTHGQRQFVSRDGSVPIITHPLPYTLTANENVPEFAGKLLFVQPKITYAVLAQEYETNNAMTMSVLSPTGSEGGDMVANLMFEGVALKGYGATPGMPPAWAPEEVTLS